MKKVFYSVLALSIILIIAGEKLTAQEKMIDGYYPSELLDGVKSSKTSMIKDSKIAMKLQQKFMDILHLPRISDGSKRVDVYINFNLFIDENGKFIKSIAVDKLQGIGWSKWDRENTIINPKEAADIMNNDASHMDFKIGKKNGKPVKYYYNYEFSMATAPSKNKDSKQPQIIVEGDEFYKSLDKVPAPVKAITPHYPEIAKRAGIEGKVMVRVLVDEKGNVAEAEAVKEVGSGLDESALTAVKAAKFKPGILNGKPVKVRIVIPVEYKLNKEKSFDLATDFLEINPKELKVNQKASIHLGIVCKSGVLPKKKHWYVYMYINDKMIFGSIGNNANKEEHFFSWTPTEKGVYNYKVVIDPENVLKEENRSNNTIKGSLEVK